ncbi:MAG: hypothetical protein JOZ05_14605 [Acetobacteraceae bacterium]|nr:hypothetical protein [Acetobacteraceae bacterium]
MNHIHRLRAERDHARAALKSITDALHGFRAHLLLPKFQGFDESGARKDWIATSDVLARLQEIISIEGDVGRTAEPERPLP